MSIEVRGIRKTFGNFVALDNVSLDFPTGQLVALLGPSGCGKTTLLRIIAGLEYATEGNIILDGEDASDKHVRERQVGFVFQHYALFRHMTVFDNVAFGLRVKPRRCACPRREIKRNVKELLELVQLDWLADRYPSQLSGGQRQRIALARALAVRPRVLLLDEPFGALDAKVRKELRRWLRRLHDELHITSLFVTHDQDEAVELADRLVLMNRGKVEQAGTVREVYAKPATPFVYSFLGAVNKFTGQVQGDYPARRRRRHAHRRRRRHGGPRRRCLRPAARARHYRRPGQHHRRAGDGQPHPRRGRRRPRRAERARRMPPTGPARPPSRSTSKWNYPRRNFPSLISPQASQSAS